MNKRFAIGEVKALEDESHPNGAFEVILSMPTVDRDGEVIDAKAFEPLPQSIPFHAYHDFSDPVGRAVPFYEGDTLKARGYYASTVRAQEIRSLVTDGVIGHTSVGFMPPTRKVVEGVPHITKGELLEGSFVSVPSNREAAVLMAKSFRPAHDNAGKTITGSLEERRQLLRDAIRAASPDAWWTDIVATFDDTVVYEIETIDGATQYQASYEIVDGAVTLGEPEPVTVTEVVSPKGVTQPAATNPEVEAAAPAAAEPPADVPAGKVWSAIAEAQAALLLT